MLTKDSRKCWNTQGSKYRVLLFQSSCHLKLLMAITKNSKNGSVVVFYPIKYLIILNSLPSSQKINNRFLLSNIIKFITTSAEVCNLFAFLKVIKKWKYKANNSQLLTNWKNLRNLFELLGLLLFFENSNKKNKMAFPCETMSF